MVFSRNGKFDPFNKTSFIDISFNYCDQVQASPFYSKIYHLKTKRKCHPTRLTEHYFKFAVHFVFCKLQIEELSVNKITNIMIDVTFNFVLIFENY